MSTMGSGVTGPRKNGFSLLAGDAVVQSNPFARVLGRGKQDAHAKGDLDELVAERFGAVWSSPGLRSS